jgi:hypothetical protein
MKIKKIAIMFLFVFLVACGSPNSSQNANAKVITRMITTQEFSYQIVGYNFVSSTFAATVVIDGKLAIIDLKDAVLSDEVDSLVGSILYSNVKLNERFIGDIKLRLEKK